MEVRDFCETILYGDRLEDKLVVIAPGYSDQSSRLSKPLPDVPGRSSRLAINEDHRKKAVFPSLHEMGIERVRGEVFHFFANHELLALELMALALLKFPESPKEFRDGIVHTMIEEQQHLKLYLGRMEVLGIGFGELSVNNFFWHCLRDMATPFDYTVGMSMTFEQANLDHCLFYKNHFQILGDQDSADILEKVYHDEIGHVGHGVKWFERLRPQGESQWHAYHAALKHPLSPRRARGIKFGREAREKAGLDPEYIDHLEQYSDRHNKSSILYYFNSDCEERARDGGAYTPSKRSEAISSDLECLPMLLAKKGDYVLCRRQPANGFMQRARQVGFVIPEFVVGVGQSLLEGVKEVRPWGWTEETLGWQSSLRSGGVARVAGLYDKGLQVALRQKLRTLGIFKGSEISWSGAVASNVNDVLDLVGYYYHTYKLPTVLKAAYGAAGRGMIRVYDNVLQPAQKLWLEKQLRHPGYVVVEPWFAGREWDLSVLLNVQTDNISVSIGRFLVDSRGQYRGHVIGRPSGLMCQNARRKLHESDFLSALEALGDAVGNDLRERGFIGRCGIDAFTFGYEGAHHLRPLGEVNGRLTMGHLAQSLSSRVTKSSGALFLLLGLKDLKLAGVQTFADLQQYWQRFPVVLDESRDKKIRSGIHFLTDPQSAKKVVSILVVGECALKEIRRLFKDVEHQTYMRR